MKVPKDFPKWNKAIDGLEDAGMWALDCERSRMPTEIVIPREGQIWQATRTCEVAFRTHLNLHPAGAGQPKNVQKFTVLSREDFESYMMQFGTATLPEGERVRILQLGELRPVSIRFVPVRYHELQESIVPAEVRKLPFYAGRYELSVKTARTVSDFQNTARQSFFNEDFKLIEDAL